MKGNTKEQEAEIIKLKSELADAKEKIESYRQDVDSRDRYILQLQRELNEIVSFKKHAKKVARKQLKKMDSIIERRLNSAHLFNPAVPVLSDNLLEAARLADEENLRMYNDAFSQSKSIRVYRKLKNHIRDKKRGK